MVVAVTEGILGCGFQPAAASVAPGSTVRFRNDTSVPVTVVIGPPAGVTIVLDSGGTSGITALTTPATYAVSCASAGAGPAGRMTITVAGA